MRPSTRLLLPLLLATCAAQAACGERAPRSASPSPPVAEERDLASVRAEAEAALRDAEAGGRAAEEALAQANEAREASRRLMDRLAHERRSRTLTAEGVPPWDPARPRPPAGLALDGEVVSFDASSGVVVLSLGAPSGIQQGYRLTISRGSAYVGVLEIDGVEAERSRGRTIESLQKLAPQPGDRVLLR